MAKQSTGKRNKQRGYEHETECVKYAREAGLEAERMWTSDGRSRGLSANVDITIEGEPFQCKRRKKLADYLSPEPGIVGQIVREDHGKNMIILPYDLWLRVHKILKDNNILIPKQ